MTAIKNILIACAGLHGTTAAITIASTIGYRLMGFLDDHKTSSIIGYPVLGPTTTLNEYRKTVDLILVGSANVRTLDFRTRLTEQVLAAGFGLANAIHEKSFICRSSRWGQGLFTGPFTAINSNTVLGIGVSIYGGTVIEHDNKVGDHVFIGPGVCTGGGAIIESHVYLSAGCVVGSGVRVGQGSIIGAGSVVLSDIPPGTLATGAPAAVQCPVSEWLARKS